MKNKLNLLLKKRSYFVVIVSVILVFGSVSLLKLFSSKKAISQPLTITQDSIKKPVSIPLEAKYLFLAGQNSNGSSILTFKVDKYSGKTISQNSFTLTKEMGHMGCSSFQGSYSVCKNAVWFYSSGEKAIVQTEYQGVMFEEPPFWYAWYLLDIKSGKLTELYKADIRLVEWQFDEKNDKVYIITEIENNKNEPLPKKYFQVDVGTKNILEISKNEYPDNIFIDYYPFFDFTAKNKIKYNLDGNFIETNISVGISSVAGIGWGK